MAHYNSIRDVMDAFNRVTLKEKIPDHKEFEYVYGTVIDDIKNASYLLQKATCDSRMGLKMNEERASALERCLHCCEKASITAEESLARANSTLELRLADKGQLQQAINDARRKQSCLQHKVQEYQERTRVYESEVKEAIEACSTLQAIIESRRDDTEVATTVATVASVGFAVLTVFVPIVAPVTIPGITAMTLTIAQATTKLRDMERLRYEKEQNLAQQKRLLDEATKEKRFLSQQMVSKEQDLASLKAEEAQLRHIIKDLGEKSHRLKQTTTQLSTLCGTTEVVTVHSRSISGNPFASVEGLISNIKKLEADMFKACAHLSLGQKALT